MPLLTIHFFTCLYRKSQSRNDIIRKNYFDLHFFHHPQNTYHQYFMLFFLSGFSLYLPHFPTSGNLAFIYQTTHPENIFFSRRKCTGSWRKENNCEIYHGKARKELKFWKIPQTFFPSHRLFTPSLERVSHHISNTIFHYTTRKIAWYVVVSGMFYGWEIVEGTLHGSQSSRSNRLFIFTPHHFLLMPKTYALSPMMFFQAQIFSFSHIHLFSHNS